MVPGLQPLVAPNAVKNESLNDAKAILYPQLFLLSLQPTGLYGIATASMGTGSGPGGSYTEQEMTALGLLPDDKIFLQFQLSGAGDIFCVADCIRILEGYRSDSALEPDPNFWYTDRVRKLFEECGLSLDAADNAMLNIPAVKQAVEDSLKAATVSAPAPGPTPAPSGSTSFELIGPVVPVINNALKGLVLIGGTMQEELALTPDGHAWDNAGHDITSMLTTMGVDVAAIRAAMEAASK